VLSHAPGTSVWAPEVTDRNGSGIQAVTIQASSPHPRRPRAEGPSGRGLRRQRRSRWGRGEAEQLLQADENCPPWALRAGCRLALIPPPNPLPSPARAGEGRGWRRSRRGWGEGGEGRSSAAGPKRLTLRAKPPRAEAPQGRGLGVALQSALIVTAASSQWPPIRQPASDTR
jgi:hypothetical protein